MVGGWVRGASGLIPSAAGLVRHTSLVGQVCKSLAPSATKSPISTAFLPSLSPLLPIVFRTTCSTRIGYLLPTAGLAGAGTRFGPIQWCMRPRPNTFGARPSGEIRTHVGIANCIHRRRGVLQRNCLAFFSRTLRRSQRPCGAAAREG